MQNLRLTYGTVWVIIDRTHSQCEVTPMLPEIFEIIMILCFGISWPFNVMRSYRARTTKGKSLAFLICIIVGYIAGIASKLTSDAYMSSFSEKWYVLIFYFINITMVIIDLFIYIRNYFLDKARVKESA